MLAAALLLDAVFGEPDAVWRRFPHPVVLIGRLVAVLDERLNRGAARRLRGAAALGIVVVVAAAVAVPLSLHPAVESVAAAVLLAQRSLCDHVGDVGRALSRSLVEGRRSVAMIVGRDPQDLDRSGVARAAIESAAENWSDGLVAPAFWFVVGGLPGMAIYKATNTADSMIGHRTERHRAFGWASARFDDLLNWIPARLSGLLLCLIGRRRLALSIMLRDARHHRSPNAGWPEAAMAANLGVALAGPRNYGGVPTNDPFLYAEGRREATAVDVRDAVTILWMAWSILFLAAMVAAALGFF